MVAYERREAQWPEQLNDVMSALRHLQARWGFGERYLLVGHSVGATMALLAALKAGEEEGIEAPLGVVGVCGIYDWDQLHRWSVGCESLTTSAGLDEQRWREASPGRIESGVWEERWARGRKRSIVLGQGRGDELVDFEQAVGMQRVFDGEGREAGMISCDLMEVGGRHNEVWEKGDELVRVIGVGMGEMLGLDQ